MAPVAMGGVVQTAHLQLRRVVSNGALLQNGPRHALRFLPYGGLTGGHREWSTCVPGGVPAPKETDLTETVSRETLDSKRVKADGIGVGRAFGPKEVRTGEERNDGAV